jgi:ribosome-binding ATPase
MLIGLIGKPSSGKSTFFKAMTLANIDIANYPFTTIKPNHGAGHVKILDVAQERGKPANPREGYVQDKFRFVPVDLLDVAGLVPGAHEGKGMGSQFLDDLNQADALIHVVDISGSTNEKGEPVPPLSYNPSEDIRFLEFELDMWYLRILKKGWEKFARQVQQEHLDVSKAIAKQLSGLRVVEDMVKKEAKELPENPLEWNEEQMFELASELRKQTKPMIIACNKIDVPGAEENYKRLKEEFPEHILVPCSAESELALKEAEKHNLISYIPGENHFEEEKELNEKQKEGLELVKNTVLSKFNATGVQKTIDTAVFDILKRIAIHPGGVSKLEDSDGNVLPDCFLMKEGTTALEFAFRLHTDFGKKFIRAIDVKTKRTIGKDHILKHLDIVELIIGK